MQQGEVKQFKIVVSDETGMSYYWKVTNGDAGFDQYYDFIPASPGRYSIRCEVSKDYKLQKIFNWDVVVDDVIISPLQTSILTPGKEYLFQAAAGPEGNYDYKWYLDGGYRSTGNAVNIKFSRKDKASHKLKVEAKGASSSYSFEKNLFVPYASFASLGSISPILNDDGTITMSGIQLDSLSKIYYVLVKINPETGLVSWLWYLEDYLSSIIKTKDSGILGLGFRDNKLCVIKFNSLGITQWKKYYDVHYQPILDYRYYFLCEADGGTFIAVTDWDNDITLVKIDEKGKVLWEKTYGGRKFDGISTITEDGQGGCVIAGSTSSTDIPGNTLKGGCDAFMLNVDKDGNQKWWSLLGGTGYDWFSKVIKTSDGGFLGVGIFDERNVYVAKVDASGSLEWEQVFNVGSNESMTSAVETPEGYFIGGRVHIDSFPSLSDEGDESYLAMLDKSGNLIWQKTFGNTSYGVIDSLLPADEGFVALAFLGGVKADHVEELVFKFNDLGE